ncbi:hypothetical protein [Sphingobium aquiterrae]|uniref:hypothetical protein n=1 Tax=Sphingobium aquiterrae TaxID=2038656 RepID=UPI003015F032
MGSPIEQIVAMTKANGRLAAKLAEIARSGGQDCAQIGSKAAATFVDQWKAIKPGTVASFRSDDVMRLFGEIEQSREVSLDRVKAAFDEWQGSWKDLLSQVGDQQPWFLSQDKAPAAAAPEKAKAPPRAASKKTETA